MPIKILNGVTFDAVTVYPNNDASLYGYLNSDVSTVIPNRGNEMAVTTSGLNLIIGRGHALICGRFVEITSPITVPATGSGSLVIELDISQTNTHTGTPGQDDYDWENNQISVKATNVLRNDDLHNGGTVYSFVLGTFTQSGGTLTFTRNDDVYNGYQKTKSVNITDVIGLGDILTNIQNEIDQIEDVDLTDVYAAIDAINDQLDDLEEAVTNLESLDFESLQDAIDDLTDRVEALESEEYDPTDILDMIDDLSDRVTVLESQVIEISDVNGLTEALLGKANVVHTHEVSDINDLDEHIEEIAEEANLVAFDMIADMILAITGGEYIG